MIQTVVAVNGELTSGKDTFCNFCWLLSDDYITIQSISSVDQIKDVATQLGWDGVKDDKSRKFLSDLKDLSTEYNDGPFKYIQSQIHRGHNILFVHIRELSEIDKLRSWVSELPRTSVKVTLFKSIKIVRDSVKSLSNNTGDLDTQKDYPYDEMITNNGTLKDLQEKAALFVETIHNEHSIVHMSQQLR